MVRPWVSQTSSTPPARSVAAFFHVPSLKSTERKTKERTFPLFLHKTDGICVLKVGQEFVIDIGPRSLEDKQLIEGTRVWSNGEIWDGKYKFYPSMNSWHLTMGTRKQTVTYSDLGLIEKGTFNYMIVLSLFSYT